MTTEPAAPAKKANRALVTLWVVGILAIVGGLIAHVNLKEAARSDARVAAMLGDLTDTATDGGIDYTAANLALWVVGLGVLMVVAAIIVQAVNHKPAG